MLEPLVGRLKWERTEDGVRVVIPSRFSWWRLLAPGLSLLTLPHFTYEVFWKSRYLASMDSRSFIPEWVGARVVCPLDCPVPYPQERDDADPGGNAN